MAEDPIPIDELAWSPAQNPFFSNFDLDLLAASGRASLTNWHRRIGRRLFLAALAGVYRRNLERCGFLQQTIIRHARCCSGRSCHSDQHTASIHAVPHILHKLPLASFCARLPDSPCPPRPLAHRSFRQPSACDRARPSKRRRSRPPRHLPPHLRRPTHPPPKRSRRARLMHADRAKSARTTPSSSPRRAASRSSSISRICSACAR